MPTPERILVALSSKEIADALLRGIRIYQALHPHDTFQLSPVRGAPGPS